MHGLLQGETSDDMAMAFAQGPEQAGQDDDRPVPTTAILLQSYPHHTEQFGHPGQWESFLTDCAGEWEVDGVQQSLEPIGIAGVDGYIARTETAEDAQDAGLPSMSAHVAHVDFGQTSLRIIGLDLSDEEMAEVVEGQLQKLESAE